MTDNDIINCQQAEIERLKDRCSNCCVVQTKSEKICDLQEQIEYWKQNAFDGCMERARIEVSAKEEATKEFAKKLKKAIDDIVKEMTGEQK